MPAVATSEPVTPAPVDDPSLIVLKEPIADDAWPRRTIAWLPVAPVQDPEVVVVAVALNPTRRLLFVLPPAFV